MQLAAKGADPLVRDLSQWLGRWLKPLDIAASTKTGNRRSTIRGPSASPGLLDEDSRAEEEFARAMAQAAEPASAPLHKPKKWSPP
jgi:hypothetical protein